MKKDLRTLCQDWLTKNGFIWHIDKDGDIFFKYHKFSLFIILGDDDPTFLRLLLPEIHRAVTADDKVRAIFAANTVSLSIKLAKVVVHGDFVHISAENFLPSNFDLEDYMPRMLAVLPSAYLSFHKKMEETEAKPSMTTTDKNQ